MSSKKRRRLYEGFGVLEANSETPEQVASNPPEPVEDKIVMEANEEQSSIINSNKIEKKTVEKIENNYLLNKLSIENNDREKSLNNFSIENKLENQNRKTIETPTVKLERIIGLQKQALLAIYDHCQMIGSRTTSTLGIAFLVERLNTSQLNAHNLLNELVKKKVITRVDFQRGRGGWSKWQINEATWNEINLNSYSIEKNYRKNIEQTIEKPSNSSGNLNKIEIQTTIQIPENLKTLISKNEVADLIHKGVLPESELKESLEHFAYDFANGLVRAKTNPINLFFGLTRSGKKYRSLALIEQQNEDLRAYQEQLEVLEAKEKELKQKALKMKFEQFKASNPKFLDQVAEKNPLVKNADVLENLAFQDFLSSISN